MREPPLLGLSKCNELSVWVRGSLIFFCAKFYGSKVRSLINQLFAVRGLIKDGAHGQSLVERTVNLLDLAIALG